MTLPYDSWFSVPCTAPAMVLIAWYPAFPRRGGTSQRDFARKLRHHPWHLRPRRRGFRAAASQSAGRWYAAVWYAARDGVDALLVTPEGTTAAGPGRRRGVPMCTARSSMWTRRAARCKSAHRTYRASVRPEPANPTAATASQTSCTLPQFVADLCGDRRSQAVAVPFCIDTEAADVVSQFQASGERAEPVAPELGTPVRQGIAHAHSLGLVNIVCVRCPLQCRPPIGRCTESRRAPTIHGI